jgi:prolyl oligopeptidase
MRSVQLTKGGVVLFFSDDRTYRVELLRPDGSREKVADSAELGKDAVIQAVQARRDGRAVALHYSQGGSDEGTVAMLDLESGRVVDRLQGFIGSILWLKRGDYYYVRTYRKEKAPDGVEPPADRVLLRNEEKDEEVVFGTGLPTNTFIGMAESQDGSKALLDTSYGWTRSRPYGGTVRRPESWVPLYPEVDSIVSNIDYHKGRHLLLSFERSRGEVVSVGSHGTRKLLRETGWPLQEVALVGDGLLCHYLVDACSELRLHHLDGRTGATIKFPVPGSLIASPSGPGISAVDGEATVAFSSFTLPFRVYRVKGSKLEELASEEISGRFSTAHRHTTSADGTRVHYFLTAKRGTSPKKALLLGYGGFRVSLTPFFDPLYLPLLEDGAAFAAANLRGGMEYGEEWHRAGMREKKPNVFDDYLAILAELKRKGMDVVGLGGSNGGLLMGATMNARPDLFSGVLIGYPVLDMMAYHRLLLGKAWVPEYGDPDNPRDRKFLMKYSPYHNILSGKKYPPVFIYTGLKDDRVHPAHAFKFYAKLKETGANVALRVETKSGHSGTTPETRIREAADKLAFAYQSLGLTA